MRLEMTVSPGAAALRDRVRAFLASPEARLGNLYYQIAPGEEREAEELVDRGVCFYSMDRSRLGATRG